MKVSWDWFATHSSKLWLEPIRVVDPNLARNTLQPGGGFHFGIMSEFDNGMPSPHFASPSKRGTHHTPTPFTTTETRFKWQNSNANTG